MATPTMLDLVVVGGSRQRILRPAELEASGLAGQLEQSAFYGDSGCSTGRSAPPAGVGAPASLRQERGAATRVTGAVSLWFTRRALFQRSSPTPDALTRNPNL